MRYLSLLLLIVTNSYVFSQNKWLEFKTQNLTGCVNNVSIGDLDVLGTKLTVEATIMVRPNSLECTSTPFHDVVSKHYDIYDVNYLLRPDHGEITTTNGFYFTKPALICENTLYHIAMVYDGVWLKFFRDDRFVDSVAVSGNMIQNNYDTNFGYTGGMNPNWYTQFWGIMDNVRIWNVARTKDQLVQYAFKDIINPTTQQGLIASYNFESGFKNNVQTEYNGIQNNMNSEIVPGDIQNSDGLISYDEDACIGKEISFEYSNYTPRNGEKFIWSVNDSLLSVNSSSVDFVLSKIGVNKICLDVQNSCKNFKDCIEINVADLNRIEINRNICEGECFDYYNNKYCDEGVFEIKTESSIGCDTIIKLIITKLQNSESQLYFKLCDEASMTVNDTDYNTSGIYTQILANTLGCDSTITITIEKFNTTDSVLNIQLCDEETGIVNDVVYSETGNYTQILTNSIGCDSIINIIVKKGRSSFEEKIYSLCDQNPIVVNGQSYDQLGTFVTQFATATGCDSVLTVQILPCDMNIFYDFEKCDALVPANSMVYSEFTPSYLKTLDCGKINAQNIYREDPQVNKHSCTPGFNNSIAMCVSASASCDVDEVNTAPIIINFSMIPENGHEIKFNHLIFQQKAPLGYDWIAGPQGLNNYPTKYAIKIYKDNVEIFSQEDIQTSNDWTKEKYDFYENDVFSSIDSTNIRIELTPYCQIGNAAIVSVWDVDDLALIFSCQDVNNRTISGKIVNASEYLQNIEIRRQFGHTQITTNTSGDGTFFMPKNNVDKAYIFTAFHNENTRHGLTTLDLLLTQRHILGIETFTHPLQYLAADVNNDKKVTALDLVHMRKIILGIETHFKNNTSWIFLDEASVKAESNPWSIKKYIPIPEGHQNLDHVRFVALKVGDVDGALQIVNQQKKIKFADLR